MLTRAIVIGMTNSPRNIVLTILGVLMAMGMHMSLVEPHAHADVLTDGLTYTKAYDNGHTITVPMYHPATGSPVYQAWEDGSAMYMDGSTITPDDEPLITDHAGGLTITYPDGYTWVCTDWVTTGTECSDLDAYTHNRP